MGTLRIVILAFVISGIAAGFAIAQKKEQLYSPPPTANVQDLERDKVFNAFYTLLENGMEVVVIPNHRAPVVTHMVWYKAGAADEPWGKSGIAHFLEHLMFKGSTYTQDDDSVRTLNPGEFSYIVKSLGGQDNAFTSQDYTAYYQSVPKEHLPLVMRMEAGRMHGMTLTPEQVVSERKVILEERRQRTDNNPQAQFLEQVNAALYINHPYAVPVIGWESEIAGLTLEDAKGFYDLYYAPNNAVLVVSGDVAPDEVFDLAKEIYGPLEKRDTPARARPASPPLPGDYAVKVTHPLVRQPTVSLLTRAPSYREDEETALALEVLAEIMGGGTSSRLYKSLVVAQKIASAAGMSYNENYYDDGSLYLYAVPVEGVDLETVRAALIEEVEKLISGGVGDDELKEAVTRMQDSAVYARDSLNGPATTVGGALAIGVSLDDVETWSAQLEKVSADAVVSAAQRYLQDTREYKTPMITGYLLPESSESADIPAPQEEAPP